MDSDAGYRLDHGMAGLCKEDRRSTLAVERFLDETKGPWLCC